MMTWFRLNGLDPRQVNYLEVPINQMNVALRNAQVDAAMPVEPFASLILAAKTATQFMPLPPPFANPATVYSFWTMRRAYIASHPDVLRGFRAALDDALAWMKQNPEAARRTQITYLKTSETAAMTAKLAPWSTHIGGDELKFWIDACQALGLTKGTVGVADILAPPA